MVVPEQPCNGLVFGVAPGIEALSQQLPRRLIELVKPYSCHSNRAYLFLACDADHFLALRDVMRHQFLGQDMLARLEAVDRTIGMLAERHGNDDRFDFLGTAFGNLATGALAQNRFQSSASDSAQDSAIRFFFETDTGILRFDRDGSANAFDAVIIATLAGNATMTADDIFIL